MDVRQLFGSDCEYYVWDHVVVALHLEEEQVSSLLILRVCRQIKFFLFSIFSLIVTKQNLLFSN